MTRHIVAIGQLPPPLNGFSFATKSMIALLSEANSITVANIAPPFGKLSLLKHPVRIARVLGACLQLFRDRKRVNRVCYLGCEGGLGLIYTLLIVLVARTLGYPTYLHHHSFSYVEKPSLLMRCILTLGGRNLRHIFLCDMMRDRFADTYGGRTRCHLISNAAYVAPREESDEATDSTHLVIGMLSNLTAEKGLDTFLDLARQARKENLPIKAVLAGPAGAGERARIDAAVAEMSSVLEYRGPLYDDAKTAFYREIDVFVFPTTYTNEAQPLVIFEAKAAGNAVISCNRGCIGKQLDESDLLIPSNGDFIPTALAWLSAMSPDPALAARRKAIRQSYKARHAKARAAVTAVFDFDEA
ncbi:glycosyltransferase involved in cell wall biosynthesis [Rhizobium sp. BK181]|uniref:glycosyltransferase family 4 protein n=1 Tax=Rhizobium sp. BK181 TaxID=2587072 RepID=UPI00161FD93F|nr:glycosyltransferase family 4 protein [Rhizobium sp. BK181]MBB3317017.1 glycosyltransferase involved in cell wall biosynthesis [Rhizobium sp. BK181]